MKNASSGCILAGSLAVGLLWSSSAQVSIEKPVMVKNINTNSATEVHLLPLAALNGLLLFAPYMLADGGSGQGWATYSRGLWKSDGTSQGTVRVKDVSVFLEYGLFSESEAPVFAKVNGSLFFAGDDGHSGVELWKSDGTAAGTVEVKDIVPGPDGSSPDRLVAVKDTLFFFVGADLWKSDGTENGTTRIENLGHRAQVRHAVEAGGRLFFAMVNETRRAEVWVSDGTRFGTYRVTAESNFIEIGEVETVHGLLFFTGLESGKGYELWRTDGTRTGTVLVKDIRPGAEGAPPHDLVNVNGTLFFAASDSTSLHPADFELWKSDRTEAGTKRVKDINPGATGSDPINLINVNGALLFNVSERGGILWQSDGTEAGTILLSPKGFDYWVVANNMFFFTRGGRQLWKSDGTVAGTVLVTDLTRSYSIPFPPLMNVNGIVFIAANGSHGTAELWKSDGTANGTVRVKAIELMANRGSFPRQLTSFNGSLLFHASDGTNDLIWQSDGTDGGTTPIGLNGMPVNVRGEDLWKTDGTELGTTVVLSELTSRFSYVSPPLATTNGLIFFWAWPSDQPYGSAALWRSDGTPEGTALIREFPTFQRAFLTCGDSWQRFYSSWGVVRGDSVWFFTPGDTAWPDASMTVRELWKSDGTVTGTVRAVRRAPDLPYCGMEFFELVNVNGTLFFKGDDGVNGVELWKFMDADVEGNGLPDWWETKFFVGTADPNHDPDQDGMTNWQESRAGTDPLSGGSVLKFGNVQAVGPGRILLRWPSEKNQEYVLERSSGPFGSLEPSIILERRILATPPVNSHLEMEAPSAGATFYRLKLKD